MEFKLVRKWDKKTWHWYLSDYEFWIDKSGVTNFRRHSWLAFWEELQEKAMVGYYKARYSLHRAARGEVAT